MGYEIRELHLDDDSPEGRAVQTIVAREGVTPEEAVRLALRGAERPKTPAEELIGLFSSPEDLAIFEEAMSFVHENRERTMLDHARNDFDVEGLGNQVLGGIVVRESVKQREAMHDDQRPKTPVEEMWGLFSNPDDLAIFEEAMELTKDPRHAWEPRELEP